MIKMTFSKAARQSPPVAKYAPIGPGNVHGANVTTGLMRFNDVANHEIVPKINGVIINGIIITGFNTIGVPNTNGSLILNTAGINEVLPSAFRYADFEKKAKRMAKPIVAPEPPILINH